MWNDCNMLWSPLKKRSPAILQLPIFGPQFLNPSFDPCLAIQTYGCSKAVQKVLNEPEYAKILTFQVPFPVKLNV